jgi:S1-C subfamily serine protease
VSTARRSTRNLRLAVGGAVLALVSASQSLRSVDQQSLDVTDVSDPAIVSAAANLVPVVRITASTCVGLEAGSGLVLGHGIVVTAAHVIEGATSATVDIEGRGAQTASVLGVDPNGRDVALLYVPALADDPDVEIGTSRTLERGTPVSAAGHPRGGIRQTMPGAVLGYVESGPLAADGGRVLTVSAAFVPGMSGGPVVDMRGGVVGVVIGVERNTGTGIAVPTSSILDTLRGDDLAVAPTCAPHN